MGAVGAWHPQILADQLTPFQTRRADYAHHITTWHLWLQNPNTSPAEPQMIQINILQEQNNISLQYYFDPRQPLSK